MFITKLSDVDMGGGLLGLLKGSKFPKRVNSLVIGIYINFLFVNQASRIILTAVHVHFELLLYVDLITDRTQSKHWLEI